MSKSSVLMVSAHDLKAGVGVVAVAVAVAEAALHLACTQGITCCHSIIERLKPFLDQDPSQHHCVSALSILDYSCSALDNYTKA
jgi:hypothetical protein